MWFDGMVATSQQLGSSGNLWESEVDFHKRNYYSGKK